MSDTGSSTPLMPLEWHPWYRQRFNQIGVLLDWLNRTGDYASRTCMNLPVFPRMTAVPDDVSPIAPKINYVTLDRVKAVGPAPYVGRPFVYAWEAAVDQYGRGIATDSRRWYHGEPWPFGEQS